MKQFLALLILLLSAATAFSQVAILDTSNTPAGRYYCQVDIAADGSVAITQIKQVVRLDGKPAPDPDPDPVVLSDRAKAVKAAAEKATADPQRASTANGLAVAVKSVRRLVDDGTLKSYEQISQALAYLWDATARNAAWAETRTLVFNELAKLAQEGAAAQSYAVCLGDVEAGLLATIPAEQLASGELDQGTVMLNGQPLKADWEVIIQMLLEIFVKYILPLII